MEGGEFESGTFQDSEAHSTAGEARGKHSTQDGRHRSRWVLQTLEWEFCFYFKKNGNALKAFSQCVFEDQMK